MKKNFDDIKSKILDNQGNELLQEPMNAEYFIYKLMEQEQTEKSMYKTRSVIFVMVFLIFFAIGIFHPHLNITSKLGVMLILITSIIFYLVLKWRAHRIGEINYSSCTSDFLESSKTRIKKYSQFDFSLLIPLILFHVGSSLLLWNNPWGEHYLMHHIGLLIIYNSFLFVVQSLAYLGIRKKFNNTYRPIMSALQKIKTEFENESN